MGDDKARSARPGRRTFVVDRRFQLKYTALLVAIGGIVTGLFGLMVYLSHRQLDGAVRETFGQLGVPLPAELELHFREAGKTLLWLVVAVTVLMAVTLGLFGILVTHRVAGPVWVISRYVSALADGRYPRMRPLRRNDELKAFFERFQHAVEALRRREAAEADRLEQILASLSASGVPAEAAAALRAMRDQKRGATDGGGMADSL